MDPIHHICVALQLHKYLFVDMVLSCVILPKVSHTVFLLLHDAFVSLQSFNALLHKLHKYVPRGSTVVDLYSGAGVIGLSIAASRKCRSVDKCNFLDQ
jgi:tRNA/tmRNA/rRNA uracil-C5-methylase (TrmA/RlmC/RlmD family)